MGKYNDSLEVSFTGHMKKYAIVFIRIKRSSHGKGSDAFQNNLEYEGNLWFIPTNDACFRKSLEYVYKRGFPIENRQFLQDCDRWKTILTLARVQQLCRRHGLDVGVYNLNKCRMLPETVKERGFRLCL